MTSLQSRDHDTTSGAAADGYLSRVYPWFTDGGGKEGVAAQNSRRSGTLRSTVGWHFRSPVVPTTVNPEPVNPENPEPN